MTDAPTDCELLDAFRHSRSDEAFGRLVARHGAFVRAVALRRVRGDHHLAEDVSQAVFIVLARRAKAAGKSASLRGWLHATTCYAASNALRAASRRDRHEMRVDRMPEPAIANDPAALVASTDEWAAIDDALCRLRPADRDVLMLHYAEERTLAQAAELLGTTAEAVKKRVQRARERLRSLLTRRGAQTSLAERLPMLAIVPTWGGTDATLAGGVDGRAFVIAKTVVTAMRIQTMKFAAGLTLAATLAVAGVAVVVAQPDPRTNKVEGGAVIAAAPAPLVAPLASGVTVELLGVCDLSDSTKWWRPDGTPLAEPPIPGAGLFGGRDLAARRDDVREWRVAFRVRHAKNAGNAHVDFQPSVVPYSTPLGTIGGLMSFDWPPDGRPDTQPGTQPDARPVATTSPADAPVETVYVVQVRGRSSATNVDLRVSIAGGTWETLEAINPAGDIVGDNFALRIDTGFSRERSVDAQGAYLHWSTPTEWEGVAYVEAFDDFPNRERTIVAIDKAGVERLAAPPEKKTTVLTLPTTTATVTQTELARPAQYGVSDVAHFMTRLRFPGVRLADVERFEFRMRSRPALQFSEIALRPDVATHARVGPADPPRTVSGWGVNTPADDAMRDKVEFDGERLDEAVEAIARACGARIYVEWESFTALKRGGREVRVKPVTLFRPTPQTALHAAFDAAGFDQISVVASDDGQTIRVLSGGRTLRGDGRPFVPGKVN